MLDHKSMKIMYLVLLIICTIILAVSFVVDTNFIIKLANVFVILISYRNIKELNNKVESTH